MKTNEQGATVVVVISVIAVLAVLTGAALEYTSAEAKNAKRAADLNAAAAIGKSCLEHEYMYWREICRENQNPSQNGLPTSSFAAIPLPNATQFPNITGFTATTGSSTSFTVSNYKVQAVTPQFLPTATGSASPPPGYGLISITGTTNLSYYYLASADVTLPSIPKPVTFKARQIFEKQYDSPWEYAVFYVDDLENHPGAAMSITGMVQTNGNLYTGHNTLTWNDKVTYSGSWTVGFDPSESSHSGETPAKPSWPSNLPPAQGAAQQPFGLDVGRVFAASNSNNTTAVDYHQLIEVPTAGVTDPIPNQRYYDQAGIKVQVTQTYDSSGKATSPVYTMYVGAGGTGTQISSASIVYTTIKNALSTTQITDSREGGTVNLVNVDMSAITSAVNSGILSPLTGYNGIIYIADTTPSVTSNTYSAAVRLQNGATLPTSGITMASQNPVYVQGDYNTGGTPLSDSGTPTSPTVTGYTRTPSAIAADSINVLSNAWNDSNSSAGKSSRVASNTTVNAAFLAGIVPSSGGNYSGGLENFPRFLESWTNKTFTYYGSMVELWSSRQATGLWANASYDPPNRQWYFDSNFMTSPPPGSILVVNYKQGQWYQQ